MARLAPRGGAAHRGSRHQRLSISVCRRRGHLEAVAKARSHQGAVDAASGGHPKTASFGEIRVVRLRGKEERRWFRGERRRRSRVASVSLPNQDRPPREGLARGHSMNDEANPDSKRAKDLSLVARLGVALCCFEGYCRGTRLESESISRLCGVHVGVALDDDARLVRGVGSEEARPRRDRPG